MLSDNRTVLFSKKDMVSTAAISAAYLLISTFIIGFKIEQVFLVLLFNLTYYLSFGSRRFITGFSIFIVYWVVFDYMKAIPNYQVNAVHIQDLYNAEKSVFGLSAGGSKLTPNEFLALYSNAVLDAFSGIFYLCWVPVPLAFAAYLFFKHPRQFIYFSLTFFLVNLLGFVVYYIYPAAPPWYVLENGFTFIAHTKGNTAGLYRFDNLVGTPIFKSMYEKSSNVFAAMPSLHSAYPVLVLFYGVKNKLGWVNVLFAVVMAGIWFAAVYTGHHYVLDVLAGIVCAIAGIAIFNKLIVPNRTFAQFVNLFIRKISIQKDRSEIIDVKA